jgi:hypothetical protein
MSRCLLLISLALFNQLLPYFSPRISVAFRYDEDALRVRFFGGITEQSIFRSSSRPGQYGFSTVERMTITGRIGRGEICS